MADFSTNHTPLVSIIIPVKNGAGTIYSCLSSIKRSYYKNFEVIVVDDHSTDATRDFVRTFNIDPIDAGERHGANNARNIGAKQAKGEILIFCDADIVMQRETILAIVEALESTTVDAVVGLYSSKHRNETLVSQYKNLWVRYSYMKSPAAIDWLFTAVSGIKREAFQKIGGFDISLLGRDGYEDIELGKRFAKANISIVLDPEIEVEHLKRYTMGSFIKNEFFRSMGFSELAMRLGETGGSVTRGFANVYPSFILSTVYSVLLVFVGLGVILEILPSWIAAAGVAGYLMLNIRFLNYLEQVRGLFAMIVMLPFLFIDHIVCFAGSVVGAVRGIVRKK